MQNQHKGATLLSLGVNENLHQRLLRASQIYPQLPLLGLFRVCCGDHGFPHEVKKIIAARKLNESLHIMFGEG